jgi:hypothetical protein
MTSRPCYHAGVRWVAFIAVVIGLAQGPSAAAPTVEIRARTQLALGRVKLVAPGTVEVLGHLHDKHTGEGIGGERVVITIAGVSQTITTRPDGSFLVRVPAPPGQIAVVLDYPGAARLERADRLTVTTDPTKSQVELVLKKTSDDPAGARLRIDAIADGGPLALPIDLSIASVGDDSFKPVRTAQSGSELVFTRREAGGAGTYRLRAQFAGDTMYQAAVQTVTIEMTSGSTTTMSLSRLDLPFEDELVVTGRVIDDDRSPLGRAAVTLMSGDRRLAQGTTNDSGGYRFEIEGEIIGQGQFGVQVQAEPGVSFIKGSRSEPAIIRVAAPQPVPVSYTIAGFLFTALAAGGFFAARTKPWQRLRRPQPPAELPSDEGEIEQVRGGLVSARPGVVATLRRPSDDGFAGVVRDTVRGRPIDQAVVRMVLGERTHEVHTGPDGAFALEQLEAGEWRAEVAAAGHISERFAVTLPHRGELRGVRVDLVPVRERVFQLYRRAAEPVLPEPRLWGIWSPRQIVDHVRSRRPSPALVELTDFVEEVYFSPRASDEVVLPQAESRVTRAVNERARPPR